MVYLMLEYAAHEATGIQVDGLDDSILSVSVHPILLFIKLASFRVDFFRNLFLHSMYLFYLIKCPEAHLHVLWPLEEDDLVVLRYAAFPSNAGFLRVRDYLWVEERLKGLILIWRIPVGP